MTSKDVRPNAAKDRWAAVLRWTALAALLTSLAGFVLEPAAALDHLSFALFSLSGGLGLFTIVALLALRSWTCFDAVVYRLAGWAVLLGLLFVEMDVQSVGVRAQYKHSCQNNLEQIGKAMVLYNENYGGYFPFDERGPLHSVLLLYPKYVDNTHVFACPAATSTQWGGRSGPAFPDHTPLAGCRCSYGYTWHVRRDAPGDFAIAADMPGNHRERRPRGFNVLYADGHVEWKETLLCSHDLHDNVFALEPGWSPDTDTYIRQR